MTLKVTVYYLRQTGWYAPRSTSRISRLRARKQMRSSSVKSLRDLRDKVTMLDIGRNHARDISRKKLVENVEVKEDGSQKVLSMNN